MAKTESTQAEVILLEADVQNQIYNIRGLHVMIDSDLSTLYGLETKALNQSVNKATNERNFLGFILRNCDRQIRNQLEDKLRVGLIGKWITNKTRLNT